MVWGHAHVQLLGMRLQMETALHYLVLIKEAINSRCVKSITAALLRQNKHSSGERKCLKIKTHADESWGKVERRSAQLGSAHSNVLIVEREGERERDISAVQAKVSADNLTYRWKALGYGLFLKSNNSCGFFKP